MTEATNTKQSLGNFFAWMDELNRQAVQQGYWEFPLAEEIAHSRNCWIVDFDNGLTPAQALGANAR